MTLQELSNEAVRERTIYLVKKEREITTKLLEYLGEFDARSLYADEAYPSLFQYLVSELNFSEGAAARRATCARMIRRFPAIWEMLKNGDLHLTGIQMLAQHMTADNAEELTKLCKRKSKREIEEILANRFKQEAPKREVVRVMAPPKAAQTLFTETPKNDAPNIKQNNDEVPITIDPTFRISLTLDKETFDNLKRAQKIAKANDLAEALKVALSIYLDKKDPARKLTKPPKRTAAKQPNPTKRTPNIATKKLVYNRDNGQCTFINKTTNKRCPSRTHLQFDHIHPYAAGGATAEENMRLYCRTHNLKAARNFYGSGFIDKKISGKKLAKKPETHEAQRVDGNTKERKMTAT